MLTAPSVVATSVVALLPATSRAQGGGSGAVPGGASGAKVVPSASAAPVLVPPRVRVRAEPVYPADKLAKGQRASVVVELTVDATGKVTGATVSQSAGPELDEAAIEAARRLELDPATRDGVPVPARIPYRFDFAFKDVEAPSATVAPPTPALSLTGRVLTPSDEPIAGADVTAVSGAGVNFKTTTGSDGEFGLSNLPPGRFKVRIEADGFAPFVADEDVVRGSVTQVTYRPPPATGDGVVDIVVRGDRPPREVTRRVLDMREITRIPGTNGDALRAIQSLPGVARPPGLAGLLIIRGSAPVDTNVFVDGTLIPIAYHFGGLSSVVPSELLERIDFYPGNFGPEYGRVTGGIVDVAIRSPKKDRYAGLLQFDLIDGRIVAAGPIDSKTRFAIAGRRSWVDVWLGPVLRKFGTGVSTAPVYYDYQVMLERDVTPETTARAILFGSDDRLAITLNSPAASDPTLGGDLSTRTGFLRGQLRTETRLGGDVRWRNTAAVGTDLAEFSVGDYYFRLIGHPVTFRSDLRTRISTDAVAIVGLDLLWSSYDVALKFPPPAAPGEAGGPFFARPAPELRGNGGLFRPAGYAILELTPVKPLKLLPGIRADYTRDTRKWTIDPRLAARLELVPRYPKTTLKGGIGTFQQPPLPNESIPPFGTPGLSSTRTTHYDVGVEQQLSRQIDLSLEGFFKDFTNVVTRVPTSTTTASGLRYENSGSGRAYGMELLVRYNPDDRFFGWLAYTLSRSEQRLSPGEPLRPFHYDQTHIFTVLGSYKLGRGWEAGARFRYVSGSMYSPNRGGVVDFDAGAYAPIPELPLFHSRLPSFHQLDVRIDKKWRFSSWELSAYLDVQNVYNHQNPEGISYNYDYTRSDVISGLPILPIIGVRGDL